MCKLLLLFVASSTVALADNWMGKLLDAPCYDRQADQKVALEKIGDACAPTSLSTAFVLETLGKVYRLDNAGNVRAVTAIKNRADRVAGQAPGLSPSKEVVVRLEGKEANGTIAVTGIDVQ